MVEKWKIPALLSGVIVIATCYDGSFEGAGILCVNATKEKEMPWRNRNIYIKSCLF